MSLFLVCFNPEHAACSCQGCIFVFFPVLLLAFLSDFLFCFVFLIPKESSHDYTRNILLKKGQCLVPITEITAVEMGEEEDAKSQQWWTKAACETGLGTGSTASLGTWKAKQNPEAPVLQLVRTQSEPSACDSSALWLHHTAPFNTPQQMQHGYLLSPCLPPVSCIWLIFHYFNIQAWSACSGVWAMHSCDLSWSCPSYLLLSR